MIFKNLSMKDSVKSKACLTGYGLMAFGGYLAIVEKQIQEGGTYIAAGLGIIGVRDAQG